jgi:hypothetical protein
MEQSESNSNPVWDIFEPTPEDNSISEYEWREYRDIDVNVNNKIDYKIDVKDKDLYLLMDKAMLEVRFKLVKSDGSNFTANKGVALANSAFSLFEKAYYYIEDKQVNEISDKLGLFHVMRSLIHMGKDYEQTIGSNQHFYLDRVSDGAANKSYAELAGEVVVGADAAASFTNILTFLNTTYKNRSDAFIKRNTRTGNSVEMVAYLPLKEIFGVLGSWDKVFRGARHTFRFYKNTSYTDAIYGQPVNDATTATPQTSITFLSIWVPSIKPSLSVASSLEQSLVTGGKGTIKFDDLKIYVGDYANNTSLQRWRITTDLRKPVRVYVGFQTNNRTSSYQLNSRQFDNGTLMSRIHLRVNSQQYPMEEYDSQRGGLTRSYNELLRMGHKLGDYENSSLISFEEYRDVYPMWVFDLSHQPESLFNGAADIELRWTFASDVGANGKVIAVIESENALSLDVVNGIMNVKYQ